jgi:hypothetical protein
MTGSTERPRGLRTGRPRVPDFFIVGQPKSGTTALYEMLRRHPEVFMPDVKEPRFFGEDIYLRPSRESSVRLPETREEYGSLFDGATVQQRTGEASPLYLLSAVAAGQIAGLRPDARIIAIVREPASLLNALYLQFVRVHWETARSLRKALSLEAVRREGQEIPPDTEWPGALLYSEHVRYVKQLRRLYAAFPTEQVLVLVYDDFRSDNTGTVARVLRFLEVDDSAPVEAVEANPTMRARSQRLHHAVHTVSLGRGTASRSVNATVKAVIPAGVRRGALRVAERSVLSVDRKSPDRRLVEQLRRRFRGEVVAASEYLERDLVKLWGYEHLV